MIHESAPSYIQPSIRVYASLLVPKSRNWEDCGTKGIRHKNTLGAWLGLLTLPSSVWLLQAS